MERAAKRIAEEAKARDVGTLVLGLPKNMDGSEGPRAEIRRAITNEHVQERSRDVFGGAPVQALCAVMHTKNVTLNYLAFRAVARAGQLAPRLFTAIKHRK